MKKNITPILGLVLGFALVIWSIMSSGPLSRFVDVPSIVITVFGSFCALLISFPVKTLKTVPSLLNQLMAAPQNDRAALIETITYLAKKIRTEGVLSIEQDLAEIDNEMLVYGLQMVVDGSDAESIEEILETEMAQIETRHSAGQDIFNKWGEYAPAFGMVGTLVGLIAMLGDLSDPNAIGGGMATSLLTTLYGSLLANLVFLPIAKNLEFQTEEEMNTCELIIEGVMAIQKGQNPRVIEQKLKSFLSSKEQKQSEAQEGISGKVARGTEG